MNLNTKVFVEESVSYLLPSFKGLDIKSARKIVKSSKKSLVKLHKEYLNLLKKVEKEKAKAEAKKIKKEQKAAKKIEKEAQQEAKQKKSAELVQLVVEGPKEKATTVTKPQTVKKTPTKSTVKKK